MSVYLFVKTLHILSATLLVGTGFGTAFYLFFANRSGSLPAQAVVSKWVCKADFWFTTPAVIFQPLSGLYLMHLANIPFTMTWIWLTLVLYAFTGLCWLPVVVFQLQMRDLAQRSIETGETEAPAPYWRLARRWEWLGYPAFSAVVVIYFLMVFKPA